MWEGPQCPDLMNDGNKKVAALRQLSRSGQPHSRNLRLHRWTDGSATFFITKSLHPKKLVLDPEARAAIVSAFRLAVEHARIHLRPFVIMPDHWHALFALRAPWMLCKFMHDMMSYVGQKTGRVLSMHDTAWQDGYYDTHVGLTSAQLVSIAAAKSERRIVAFFIMRPVMFD
jgi:REP element-mobilizing transposase RayT